MIQHDLKSKVSKGFIKLCLEKEKVTECLTKFILPFILNGTIQFDELIKPKLVDLLNEPENMETIQEERFIPHLEF